MQVKVAPDKRPHIHTNILYFPLLITCFLNLLYSYISKDNLLEDSSDFGQVLLAESGGDATIKEADAQWVGVWLYVHHEGVAANVHHHDLRLVSCGSS